MADQHRSVARLTADAVDTHPKIGEIHQLIQQTYVPPHVLMYVPM